jgi:hypothetical protein
VLLRHGQRVEGAVGTGSRRRRAVPMVQVLAGDEDLRKRRRMRQALQDAVHEAGVAQVLEAGALKCARQTIRGRSSGVVMAACAAFTQWQA